MLNIPCALSTPSRPYIPVSSSSQTYWSIKWLWYCARWPWKLFRLKPKLNQSWKILKGGKFNFTISNNNLFYKFAQALHLSIHSASVGKCIQTPIEVVIKHVLGFSGNQELTCSLSGHVPTSCCSCAYWYICAGTQLLLKGNSHHDFARCVIPWH